MAELEALINYREFQTWSDFYLDRADEQPAGPTNRKMYRREDGPPPKELEKMDRDEIARMFGATVA